MLDITKDYEIFDNKEDIKLANPGDGEFVVPDVIRRPALLASDSYGGSMVYSAAIEFLVWKESLPVNFSPRINAVITDQYGKKYNVDTVDDGVLRSRWSIKATSQAGEGVN